jgi:hypothetical protein
MSDNDEGQIKGPASPDVTAKASPARSIPVTVELEQHYSKIHASLPPAKRKKRLSGQQTWGFKKSKPSAS